MIHPATEDPMQGPLQELRRAVEALRPFLESPDQQAEFVVIEDALARLSAPRSATARLADFDPSRLSHLLDLTATQDLLETGVAQSDWKHLREGSHVLISLSGSVGALSLQAMSESLNAIAHRQDQGALDALMPPLSGELVALIQLIRATRPPYGTAR